MDKKSFDELLFALRPDKLADYYEGWHNIRKSNLIALGAYEPPKGIDYHLIAAVGALIPVQAVSTELEKIVPGFSQRLQQYNALQIELLHDLAKINKTITRDISPFRAWL